MKCNLENRTDLISKYLMNELLDEESLKFEEHYFKCDKCFNDLKAAETALNLIARDGSNAFENYEQKPVRRNFLLLPFFSNPFKVGFAFAALVILFGLYFIFKNTSPDDLGNQQIITQDKNDQIQKVDSLKADEETQIKKDDNLIAELSGPAFAPSPYYEEWINENVRSGNDIIKKVISPQNGAKVNGDLTFSWVMIENVSVNLVIMNNDEDLIYSTKVSAENFPEYIISVNQNKLTKPGLYYWRIEDENEVLFIGKFYFLKKR